MKNEYTLIAINAKYIHSNLSVLYIKNYCRANNVNINILEFSINDSIDKILSDIYLTRSNILAFSCYIWNIDMIFKICRSFKKIRPDSIIILGGPEVSYESIEQMNSCIDYIVYGEGEITFYELIRYLENENEDIESIYGLIYKSDNNIIMNKKRKAISNLDIIPFPYDDISNHKNKIVYYETSRGCPFQCQYCLSSLEKGVRFFSLDRVFKDIDFFIENRVKQVKLVDRTFNCNKERCLSIMNYIINKKGNTNFHFEISAMLIDNDFLSVVKKAPKGLFQFEIGIQSTNPLTLKAIKRKEPFKDIKDNITKLQSIQLCHIHLDLIAGLPNEDINSFEKSFNDAYFLQPDMLQLGFLKLLKGSGLRSNASKYKIKYHSHSPYEVISTDSLSYKDIIVLKNIEKLLNNYYNSGKFKKSISYIEKKYFNNPFKLYLSLFKYYRDKNYTDRALKNVDLYYILYNYISEIFGMTLIFNELLKYDYFTNFGTPIPNFIRRFESTNIKAIVNSFVKNDKNIETYMPELTFMDIRQKLKHLSFEVFYIDVTGDLSEKEVILLKLKSVEENRGDRIISFEMNEFSFIANS